MSNPIWTDQLIPAREQMVIILYNYAKGTGQDVFNVEGMAIQNFQDWGKTSEYARNAVRWAFNEQVVRGKSATVLGPRDAATRA